MRGNGGEKNEEDAEDGEVKVEKEEAVSEKEGERTDLIPSRVQAPDCFGGMHLALLDGVPRIILPTSPIP